MRPAVREDSGAFLFAYQAYHIISLAEKLDFISVFYDFCNFLLGWKGF